MNSIDAKKNEMTEIVKEMLKNYDIQNEKEISLLIVDNFWEVIPPQGGQTSPIQQMSRKVRIREGGGDGGISTKITNIQLNWRKLLVDGSESILTIVGVIAIPWLIPLAGLFVWNKVHSILTIDISERHAAVIWAMWKSRDERDCIRNNAIFELVNKEFLAYKRREMDKVELDRVLKDLERMQCIERLAGKKWWLKEKVNVSNGIVIK